jgi:hypothetical protein
MIIFNPAKVRSRIMGRVEKTVFISYRRTDEAWGLAVFQDLTQHGNSSGCLAIFTAYSTIVLDAAHN